MKAVRGAVLIAVLGCTSIVQGQEQPGASRVDVLLAGGPLATLEDELNAAFTPDRRSVYFTRKYGDRFAVIMVSHLESGTWSPPDVAPFSGQFADYDPFVSPDGRRIFWISNRPTVGNSLKTDFDIWVAEREGQSWGEPRHLNAPVNSEAGEFYPTVASNGTLYFSSNRAGGRGRGDIYLSRLSEGSYGSVEPLGDSVNSEAFEGDPFIAPDESYLIFTGWGRAGGGTEGDLFLSSRSCSGWTTPERLPDGVNSGAQEYAPIVSPDGEWLYFASYRAETDAPRRRPFTALELQQIGLGPRNGKGSVYRVRLRDLDQQLRSATSAAGCGR